MSTSCPQCSTQLKDDYGMVTCPSCGSIVFIDMEGVAQVASETPAATTPVEFVNESALESANDSAIESTDSKDSSDSLAAMSPIEGSPPSEASDNSELDMNAFLGYAPEASAETGGAAEASSTTGVASSHFDPADPLGLSAYANSEMSAAKNGPLVVTLIVSGIDAKDLRNEIRQALQDSRFGWDAAALMSSIKGGILRIEQVSPVKATIIINRIKNLSVRIKWEQSAITEIDPASKE